MLPGVSAAGVDLGGLSEAAAALKLQTQWKLTLNDGDHALSVDPAALGITLDANATAREAVGYGRDHGDLLRGLLGQVSVPPVVQVDLNTAAQGLESLRSQIETAPVNAGIRLVNGQIQPRAAMTGYALDVPGTIAPLQADPALALADGVLKLAMIPVQPPVTDAAALVQAAGALLTQPLQIRASDPIDGSTRLWTVPPDTWSGWLITGANGLSLDAAPVSAYLQQQQSLLPAGDTLNLSESVSVMQTAIAARDTSPRIRIYHADRQHVVQAGESIISIAWNYGIPYPYIQAANPGVDALSIGQTIIVPSPDTLLPLPVVWDKRIVVNMSQQRVRVYENGALKWDWVASTGIQSSPTWPGVYQIISHEPNAYAANWNLWMPNFMGVYHPIPGTDFTNGFHGFPTRGSSQLLWTNDLGTRVTYGCILLSNQNAQALYQWAQEGVVVEIQA